MAEAGTHDTSKASREEAEKWEQKLAIISHLAGLENGGARLAQQVVGVESPWARLLVASGQELTPRSDPANDYISGAGTELGVDGMGTHGTTRSWSRIA